MLKEVVSVLVGVATTVIGGVASMSEASCDFSEDNSSRCQQVRDLSSACEADDGLPKKEVEPARSR